MLANGLRQKILPEEVRHSMNGRPRKLCTAVGSLERSKYMKPAQLISGTCISIDCKRRITYISPPPSPLPVTGLPVGFVDGLVLQAGNYVSYCYRW